MTGHNVLAFCCEHAANEAHEDQLFGEIYRQLFYTTGTDCVDDSAQDGDAGGDLMKSMKLDTVVPSFRITAIQLIKFVLFAVCSNRTGECVQSSVSASQPRASQLRALWRLCSAAKST